MMDHGSATVADKQRQMTTNLISQQSIIITAARLRVQGRPGYHGCGSIKGNRENFPKRKEKEEEFSDL